MEAKLDCSQFDSFLAVQFNQLQELIVQQERQMIVKLNEGVANDNLLDQQLTLKVNQLHELLAHQERQHEQLRALQNTHGLLLNTLRSELRIPRS